MIFKGFCSNEIFPELSVGILPISVRKWTENCIILCKRLIIVNASFFFPPLSLLFHLWFVRAGYGSESEADEEAATVTLSSDIGRVNRASTKSAVRLQEVGPRMTLQLVRVEKGLCSGEVLFSEYGTLS